MEEDGAEEAEEVEAKLRHAFGHGLGCGLFHRICLGLSFGRSPNVAFGLGRGCGLGRGISFGIVLTLGAGFLPPTQPQAFDLSDLNNLLYCRELLYKCTENFMLLFRMLHIARKTLT